MSSVHAPGDSDPRAGAPASPSLAPPVLVAALGVGAMVLEVVRVIGIDPADGRARPMVGLVLAAALALGGFSATRAAQLLRLATRRAARAEGSVPAPWALTEAHSLHAVWVIGVGASVALMGLLGLWSLADGNPSGLEPGWPLLLVGALMALLTRMAWQRTSRLWALSGDGI